MDILKLLAGRLYSPDDPAAPPADPANPPADPPADPAAPPADPPADPAADPAKPHGNTGKVPWYMQRIHEETNKRVAAETALREAITKPAPNQPAEPAAPARPAAQGPEFNQAVQEEAARQRVFADGADIRAAGLAEFPDFAQTVDILGAIGLASNDFVADVAAVDKANAHRILQKLAKDPEKAASLAAMDTRRRTAELTRMSIAEQPKNAAAAPAAPAAARPSNAPKPAPALAPGAGAPESDGLGDDVPDEVWSKNFDKLQPLRRAS